MPGEKPHYYQTAGGVVVDSEGRVLVLERDVEREGRTIHEIRLPKGTIDPGETPEEAALREVREESGYGALEITADLGSARSEYTFRGKAHQRDERYFLMRPTSSKPGPREPHGEEEKLFVPNWLPLEEAASAMSYESERDFIARAKAVMK